MKRVLLALVITFLLGVYLTAAPSGAQEEPPSDKVFVCKYITTPGEGERLQSGQNPISTSINSLSGSPTNVQVGDSFNDEQGRSLVIAFDVGQPEPPVSDCPPPNGGTTTTEAPTTSTTAPTTTTESTTTTTEAPTTSSTSSTTSSTAPTTSTTAPTSTTVVGVPTLFSISGAGSTCLDGVPVIAITFGVRPDLNGQTGTLFFSTGGSTPLTFLSGETVGMPYPAGVTTAVTLTYVLGNESASATVQFPEDCPVTTSSTAPGATTTTTIFATPPGAPGSPLVLTPGSPVRVTRTPSGGLPRTGNDTIGLVLIGLSAIGFGTLLGAAARRNNAATSAN